MPSLTLYHDYGWFLAGLVWVGILLGGWKVKSARGDWTWLLWVAGGDGLRSLIELVSYALPVVPAPNVAPLLWAERSLIACDVIVLLGLLRWCDRRKWFGRGLDWGLGAAVFVAEICLNAGVPAALGLVLWCLGCRFVGSSVQRVAAGGAVLTLAFASNGPLALWLQLPRRWVDLSAWSPVWSSAHLIAAIVVGICFLRATATGRAEQSNWRMAAGVGVAWLVVGLGLATVTSYRARSDYERGVMARVQVAASLMDRGEVAALVDDRFRLSDITEWTQPSGVVTPYGHVHRLNEEVGRRVRAQLTEIERANPDAQSARLEVIREGWVVVVGSSQYPASKPTTVGLLTLATFGTPEGPETASAPRFIRPMSNLRGSGFARAAIESPTGEVVAWLNLKFGAAQWLSSQVQPRLQTYALVAFGLGLTGLGLVQRIRTQEREKARAAAATAEAADRMKSVFLAKVSHELRTPIQSILGYSELIEPAVSDPVVRTRIGALRAHGQLMLRLVNDLLDLEAIRSGVFRLVIKPTSLRAMLEQTVESLRPRATAKNLLLIQEADPDVPQWAACDAERVRQVVINLLSNAIKFSAAGQVKVSFGWIHDSTLSVAVSDQGPGISVEDQAKLFRPFARLEPTSAEEGTGLGLVLAASLCDGMQGGITVESEPGRGSTFTATMRMTPTRPPALKAKEAAPSLARRRIMVVDDNALVRELFRSFLVDAGAEVVEVEDGEKALGLVELQSFDGVVLDIAMPRMDGITALRALRALRADLCIIVVSAHARSVEKEQALEAGANGFLAKPVQLVELSRALMATEPGLGEARRSTEALLLRLTERFRREAAGQWQAVADAVTLEAWEDVRRHAHYLKNSATVVRDERLMRACDQLERTAGQGSGPDVAAAAEACRAALSPWLAPPSPADSSESANL